MADIKPATNVATKPETQAAPTNTQPATKSPEQLIAEAKTLEENLNKQKAEQTAKIAEMRSAIKTARAKRDSYEGEDQDKVDVREFMKTQRPALWKDITELPEKLEKELEDYLLSILSPREKELRTEHKALMTRHEALQKEIDAFKIKAITEFPDFFGKPQVERAERKPRATSTGTNANENVPFSGTMLLKDEAALKVRELIAKGITSETAIIKSIYGDGFTISGSAPRAQIHQIRKEMGLLNEK